MKTFVLSKARGFRVVSGWYHPRTARSLQVSVFGGYTFTGARKLAAERLLKDHPGKELIAMSTAAEVCVWLVDGQTYVLFAI